MEDDVFNKNIKNKKRLVTVLASEYYFIFENDFPTIFFKRDKKDWVAFDIKNNFKELNRNWNREKLFSEFL
jgi:hypothetical protein